MGWVGGGNIVVVFWGELGLILGYIAKKYILVGSEVCFGLGWAILVPGIVMAWCIFIYQLATNNPVYI